MTVTAWPRRARSCAAARPARPGPNDHHGLPGRGGARGQGQPWTVWNPAGNRVLSRTAPFRESPPAHRKRRGGSLVRKDGGKGGPALPPGAAPGASWPPPRPGAPASICRIITGMLSCSGQRRWHGERQSPTWSLKSNSSAVRRASWTSSVSLSMTMPGTTGVAHEGTRRLLAVGHHLDQANQAGGQRPALFQVAKGWNVQPDLPRGLQDRLAGGCLHRLSVNANGKRAHVTSMASCGQTLRQVSQRVQISRLISCRA